MFAGIIKNTDFKALTDKVDTDLAKIQPIAKAPKVLFIYARGAGTLMVAGKNTLLRRLLLWLADKMPLLNLMTSNL
jgi:iron complex transport system substrate-binding protein